MNAQPSVENLDGLIQKIRQEGIERARLEADVLIAAAKQQAADLVAAAEAHAQKLLRAAEAQRQQDAAAFRQARERAARDWLLTVRAALTDLLQRLIHHNCRAALAGPPLEELIRSVAVAWMQHGGDRDLALLLSERDAQALTDSFLAELQTELRAGVLIKPDPAIDAGFQIGGQGQSMFFDFTDAALAESLAASLGPRFATVLDPLRHTPELETEP